jgi:hypothetical protein
MNSEELWVEFLLTLDFRLLTLDLKSVSNQEKP